MSEGTRAFEDSPERPRLHGRVGKAQASANCLLPNFARPQHCHHPHSRPGSLPEYRWRPASTLVLKFGHSARPIRHLIRIQGLCVSARGWMESGGAGHLQGLAERGAIKKPLRQAGGASHHGSLRKHAERAELLAEDNLRIATHPGVKRRRINFPEVNRKLKIAIV